MYLYSHKNAREFLLKGTNKYLKHKKSLLVLCIQNQFIYDLLKCYRIY